jgi:hypothetical protein
VRYVYWQAWVCKRLFLFVECIVQKTGPTNEERWICRIPGAESTPDCHLAARECAREPVLFNARKRGTI